MIRFLLPNEDKKIKFIILTAAFNVKGYIDDKGGCEN